MLASGLVKAPEAAEDNEWAEADIVTVLEDESFDVESGMVEVDFSFLLEVLDESVFELEELESFELSVFFLIDFLDRTETE